MPLSKTITRHVTNPRKIAFISVVFGLSLFLLFTVITLLTVWHQRSQNHDKLARDTQNYVINAFSALRHTLAPLSAFTTLTCPSVNRDLTQIAAFAGNIRAILIVSKGIAYCSSATGSMAVPLTSLSPDTRMDHATDIRLLPGTPMMPGKPAVAFWLKTPGRPDSGVFTTLNINLTDYLLMAAHQQEVSGMAVVVGDNALTTWQQRVISIHDLPVSPLKTISIPGYSLKLQFYGETLPLRDIHLILLAGLLLSVIGGSGCFLLMTLQIKPGKEILLGIKRGEFHVEYQPVIESPGGKAYGLEALLRWTHPTEGPISPDTFISYAEGKNLIVPLTRHLFELVARDANKLRHFIPAGTCMGLNLSPKHLADAGFCDDVRKWMAAMPQGHFTYVFEITERTMVEKQNADEIFDWIHDQGIRIAIDDFGTGHSALIYLEKFKFDYLKIDRGFVQSIGLETVTSPVLDTVLTLARKLNLRTVAEGVETLEQAQWLEQRGVTHMQGYYFSRPCTVPKLIEYFERGSASDAPLPSQDKTECLEA